MILSLKSIYLRSFKHSHSNWLERMYSYKCKRGQNNAIVELFDFIFCFSVNMTKTLKTIVFFYIAAGCWAKKIYV